VQRSAEACAALGARVADAALVPLHARLAAYATASEPARLSGGSSSLFRSGGHGR
jgi:hypothetical protein